MKGIVAFDSVYGNTMRVAEAIADELRANGHEVDFIDLGKRIPRGVEGEFVFVGSPTRVGRMTGRTKRFVKRLNRDKWKDGTVVAFDTILMMPQRPEAREKALRWTEHGAAPRIKEMAGERGLRAYDRVLRVEVADIKGPLVADGLGKARVFVREFLSQVSR